MSYYRSWDIVVVPFPFTDQKTNKVRPAVIVSTDALRQRNGKYIVAMITNATNAAQYGDVSISELSAAGLPIASVVRASKVAVIEDADVHKRVGTLPTADRKLVAEQLREYLAID
ncbi:type II toxin-antitoxin system PemK/MazF family toxin [Limnohabitans sp.]|jgi:mRNA interferase MazF|uniref:type II toxin-antitoxin system PemK/MazF family toxin n=1 Tax=Limnohabitans sp. TaxID=1907725 RepID=UPI0037BFF670